MDGQRIRTVTAAPTEVRRLKELRQPAVQPRHERIDGPGKRWLRPGAGSLAAAGDRDPAPSPSPPSKRPLRVRCRVHGAARTWSHARCPAEVALVIPMRRRIPR